MEYKQIPYPNWCHPNWYITLFTEPNITGRDLNKEYERREMNKKYYSKRNANVIVFSYPSLAYGIVLKP